MLVVCVLSKYWSKKASIEVLNEGSIHVYKPLRQVKNLARKISIKQVMLKIKNTQYSVRLHDITFIQNLLGGEN